jgi:hypothetical protein
MNNAGNHATVEVKRKAAREDSRYELAERGESTKVRGNFEKPDKPDDSPEQEHHRDSLGSLPPEDLRNVAVLMLLCTPTSFPVVRAVLMGRSVAGNSSWIGIWECPVLVKGKVIVRTGRSV